jgi:hypothetical protein
MTWDEAGVGDPVPEPYRMKLSAGGGMGGGGVALELVRDGESRWEKIGGYDPLLADLDQLFVTTLEPGQFEELMQRCRASSCSPRTPGGQGSERTTRRTTCWWRAMAKEVECYGLTFVTDELEAPAEVKALDATWDAVFEFARGLDWTDVTEPRPLPEDLARRVAAVLATADGGCRWCQAAIARRAGQEFPDYDWFRLIAVATALLGGRMAQRDLRPRSRGGRRSRSR